MSTENFELKVHRVKNGLMCIICNTHFELKLRSGEVEKDELRYENDIGNLEKTFGKLGVKIPLQNENNPFEFVAKNKKIDEIRDTLKNFAEYAEKYQTENENTDNKCDLLVVAVMTHGNIEGQFADSYYTWYPLYNICEHFIKKETKISQIPKLFLLQACKGPGLDSGTPVLDETIQLALVSGGKEDTVQICPNGKVTKLGGRDQQDINDPNVVLYFSTVEAFVSMVALEPIDGKPIGSVFVTELCKVIEDEIIEKSTNANNKDIRLVDVLTTTNKEIAECVRNYESEDLLQTGCFKSYVTYDIVF